MKQLLPAAFASLLLLLVLLLLLRVVMQDADLPSLH
jgi:hypothetical protein